MASIRPRQSRQDVHHGRLACAVRSEQTEHLTAADLKTDVAQGGNVSERLADAADDHGFLRRGHDAVPVRRCQACSTQDRPPALAGPPLERGLHHGANIGVHRCHIGVVAEPGYNVDRLEHLNDDLAGQRQVEWRPDEAERESERDREDIGAQTAIETKPARKPGAAGREQLGLLQSDRHGRHERRPGIDGCPYVPGTTGEVNDVLSEGGTVGVVVTAGERHHYRVVAERLQGVVVGGADEAGACEKPAIDPGEDQVVAEGVHRPSVAEAFVEVDAENLYVEGEKPAGGGSHYERLTGWNVVEPAHLRSEVPLVDRPEYAGQASCERRAPARNLRAVDLGARVSRGLLPLYGTHTGVNSIGIAAGERNATPVIVGVGSLASRRMSGSRSSNAFTATVASMRARCAPRHRCGPAPNVRCTMFVRVGSKRSGSGYRAGSRLAAAMLTLTMAPGWIAIPASSHSRV